MKRTLSKLMALLLAASTLFGVMAPVTASAAEAEREYLVTENGTTYVANNIPAKNETMYLVTDTRRIPVFCVGNYYGTIVFDVVDLADWEDANAYLDTNVYITNHEVYLWGFDRPIGLFDWSYYREGYEPEYDGNGEKWSDTLTRHCDERLAEWQAYTAGQSAGTETKPASYFWDVPADAWYAKAVNAMAEAGVVSGVGDGSFQPNRPITWAEFATILVNISIGPEIEKIYEEEGGSLKVAPAGEHWAYNYLYECDTQLHACPDYCYYDPEADGGYGQWRSSTWADDSVTRGQAISYLREFLSDAIPRNPAVPLVETDVGYGWALAAVNNKTEADIADWNIIAAGSSPYLQTKPAMYAPYILEMYRAGVVNGVDTNGTCNPYGTLTRAEFCQMLYTILDGRKDLTESYRVTFVGLG